LAAFDEQSYLKGFGQHRGELIPVGGREAEPLPERSRPTREEPRAARAGCARVLHCVSREPRAGTGRAVLRCHRDASDQCVVVIRAQFETGAADDLTIVVALDPESDRGLFETCEGQVGFVEERAQGEDIRC